MNMKLRLGIIAALLASVAAAFASPAQAEAEERTCRGTLGRVTVDNLRVPASATCILNGTRVKGTVKVERGATLKASAIRVIGNVQAENAKHVAVRDSTIGGSLQIVQGRNASILSTIERNRVTGDIQFFENRGRITIRGNRVNGNLQCKENSPAPNGGANVVGGNKEDQCRHL